MKKSHLPDNSNKLKHLLFLTKQFDPEVITIMDQIVTILLKQDTFVYYFFDPQNIKHIIELHPLIQATQFNIDQHEQLIDYIFTIGGDGTILFAAGLFQNRSTPPTVSFSKGTVGFLCNFEVSELPITITGLAKSLANPAVPQSWALQPKMRLKCVLNDQTANQRYYHCFNEIAVQKAESSRQLRLEVYIGKKLLTGYSGDGLLVATPTGSTAYALSAGGPIVNNEIRSMLIVPISPNSLSFRPILMPPTTRLVIKVNKYSIQLPKNARNKAKVSVDGFVKWNMEQGDQLSIETSSYDVNSKLTIDQVMSNSRRETSKEAVWADKLNMLLKWNYAPHSDLPLRPKL